MRVMKLTRYSALLVIALGSIATPARAQTGALPTPLSQSLQGEAKDAYDSAEILVTSGDYKGALAKLGQAYEASKDARLLYEMAICEKDLRHYARMQSLLDRYLRDGEGSIPSEVRAAVDEALAVIKNLVATVTVTAIEPEATVLVDGEVVGVTPLPAPLTLDLGKHSIAARKEGFEANEQAVELLGGSAVSLTLVLIARSHVAQLVVTSEADATIRIDGRVVGVGHFEGPFEPGTHTVQLTAGGKEPQRAVLELRDGETRTLQVTLQDQKRVGPWPWLIGGAAVLAGAVVGGYFLFKVHDEIVAPGATLGTVYVH